MKQIVAMIGAFTLLASSAQTIAQDEPGAVATSVVEAVVTVRGVHYVNRTVTVEGPEGRRITINVPEEAQNLYQVSPGAKFLLTYGQAVAVGVLAPGEEPSIDAGEVMKLAPKGATPGGVIVRVVQISGRIEVIDYDTRTIIVRGSQGNLREFVVSEEVQRFDMLNVGDVVGLRVTEALAMEMIAQ